MQRDSVIDMTAFPEPGMSPTALHGAQPNARRALLWVWRRTHGHGHGSLLALHKVEDKDKSLVAGKSIFRFKNKSNPSLAPSEAWYLIKQRQCDQWD